MIPRHRIYMVAVGVNATRVGSVQPLGFAESDAFHFLDRVRERFPDTRVWMLLGGDATSHAIRKALSEATRKARAERDATLVFYFSGHGALIRQDVSGTFAFATHLLTCDAVFDKKCLRNALPLSGDGGLLPLLAEYAGKKLVLLDACHGGALPPSSAGRNPLAERIKGIPLCAEQPPEPVPLVSKANLPARCWVVTASQPGQHAYEGEAAGGGILTCALLEAASRSHLSAAASRKVSWPPAQQGPLIGVDEVPLRSIVEVATERIERMGVAQTPDLLDCGQPFMVPRLADFAHPMSHGWEGAEIGPSRPAVPEMLIREQDVQFIRHFLGNQESQSRVLEVIGPESSGKTIAVAAACRTTCQTRDERDREPRPGAAPLAWVSLEEGSAVSFIVTLISYHMIATSEGDLRRCEMLAKPLGSRTSMRPVLEQLLSLVEASGGVVVFDNVESLLNPAAVWASATGPQIDHEKESTAELVAFLVKHLQRGRIVLVARHRQHIPRQIREASEQREVLRLFLRDVSAAQAQEAVLKLTPQGQGCSWVEDQYTPAAIAQAAFLIKSGQLSGQITLTAIWKALAAAVEHAGLQEDAVFLSLFHGTNTERFLTDARGAGPNASGFHTLELMGLLVRENSYYRMHPSVATQVRDQWRRRDQTDTQWRSNAARLYGENAIKEFHLCQILEARRHYYVLSDYAGFARLLASPQVWSQLRNWGYGNCARDWLVDLVECRLRPDGVQDDVKKAWFVAALCLLELDRHEFDFRRLAPLMRSLAQYKPGEDPPLMARYYRTLGEMHLVRREFDIALRLFDKAAVFCDEWQKQLAETADIAKRVRLWIEESKISLRIAELLTSVGLPDWARGMLESLERAMLSRRDAYRTALGSDQEYYDTYMSEICHELAATAGHLAAAYLALDGFEGARQAATDCIYRSLFSRAYSTGDVLGRAIGHIRYADSLVGGPGHVSTEAAEAATWHARKALALLKRRALHEVCWYTRAYAALGRALCEQGDYDKALDAIDNAFHYLPARLAPNPTGVPGQSDWHATALRADALLKRAPADDRHFDIHGLFALSQAEFERQVRLDVRGFFALGQAAFAALAADGIPALVLGKLHRLDGREFPKAESFAAALAELLSAVEVDLYGDAIAHRATTRLTDPWHEAELLYVRAYILRRKYESAAAKNQQDLEAMKFAAYLGFGLARCARHVVLMGRLLGEASQIAAADPGDANRDESAMDLEGDAAKMAGRIGADEQSVYWLARLAKSLVPDDHANVDRIEKALDCWQAIDLINTQRHHRNQKPRKAMDRLEHLLKERDPQWNYVTRGSRTRTPYTEDRALPRIPYGGELQMRLGEKTLSGFVADLSARGMAAWIELRGQDPAALKGKMMNLTIQPNAELKVLIPEARVLAVYEDQVDADGRVKTAVLFWQGTLAPALVRQLEDLQARSWLQK